VGTQEHELVRQVALGLPEVNERLSHGAPCFFVRDKRPLCYYHDEDFSSDGRISMWCPAPPGVAEELSAADGERFFRPTPSASGTFADWLVASLDRPVDEVELAAIVTDAYRLVAPKTLVARLDGA